MAFKRAERSQLWLRLAIMGPSGSGKTFTALRIAKGIAERIGGLPPAVIDTEGRSASKYADRFIFDADNLEEKNIDNYLSSMNECIGAGYKVLVIDSLSHAWKELLEEVDRIAKKSFNGNTWSAWSEGTPKQNKLINAIVNFPGHIIVTMRSKTEWVLEENSKGRMAPVKKGMAAEQGKNIEYEFDLLMELNQNHWATITKDRTGQFQDHDIEKPGEEFGHSLYDWLSAGNSPPPLSAKALEQQCQSAMTEIGSILKTVYESQRLFTEEEIKTTREACVMTKGKSPEERLLFITKYLNEKKELMRERIAMIDEGQNRPEQASPTAETAAQITEQKPSIPQPKLETLPPSEEGEGGEDEGSDAPSMYSEPEEDDGFEDDIPGEEAEPVQAELGIY
jgi:ABC-type dipeptide/oligopeptide/nickel transport system ATPase component